MIIIEDKRLDGGKGQIAHGFFGRQGGVSEGVYESLNCAPSSGDLAGAVQMNRARVAAHLSVAAEKLVTLRQIHGANCTLINGQGELPDGDGLATDKAGIALGILTADCAPILFAGQKADSSPVIGAAHAGWGGALKGIGEATITKMMGLGAKLDTIRVAIGPCIAPASYEVSIGFEAPFLERNPEDEHFFKEARKDGHLMFDLSGYVASRLAQAGIGQVTITGQDTFAEEESFFSYRRATHRGEKEYGRQISAIVILE